MSGVIAKPELKTIKGWLQSDTVKGEIAKVLPRHMSPERMARVAINALTRTPKLADCTQESFFRCLMDLSQWGLEPNGRDAHLIPYGKECTLILDYKGLVTLAYRSGKVKLIHADVIREGDLFAYDLGELNEHTPWAWRVDGNKPTESGKIIGAYCLVKMSGGVTKCEVMTVDEIEGIRQRSRAGTSGPWVTDFSEMAKKSAFRRVSKWLPLSAELKEAVMGDDDRVIDAVVVDRTRVKRAASLNLQVQSLESSELSEEEKRVIDQSDREAPSE